MALDIHLNHPNKLALIDMLTIGFIDYYREHHAIVGKRAKRSDVIDKQVRIAASIILQLIKLEDQGFKISLSKRRLDKKKTRYDNPDESWQNVKETISALVILNIINYKIGYTKFTPIYGQDLSDIQGFRVSSKIPTTITIGGDFYNYADIIDKDRIYKDLIEPIEIRKSIDKDKKDTDTTKPIEVIKKKNTKKKKRFDYHETDQHTKLRQNIDRINSFLSQYTYTHNNIEIPYRPLYRVFHNDLEHWGRFENNLFKYNEKKQNRYLYRINNQELFSIDFHAFSLATHLSLQGVTINTQEDLYQKGRLKQLPRQFVKEMIQTILNTTTPPTRLYQGGRKLLKESRSSLKKANTDEILEMIYHEYPALRTKLNNCITNIESKVLENILLQCVEHEIPVIPHHDAVYTAQQHIEAVSNFFNKATYSILGTILSHKIEQR